MRPRLIVAAVGAAAVLVTGWGGFAADPEAKLKTALLIPAAPKATIGSVASRAARAHIAPRMTAAVLRPRIALASPAGEAAEQGFRASVQRAGFDLDLARLYRHAAPAVALPPEATTRNARAPELTTWDLPMAITPADRTLASTLQRRAEQALAAQVAMMDGAGVR